MFQPIILHKQPRSIQHPPAIRHQARKPQKSPFLDLAHLLQGHDKILQGRSTASFHAQSQGVSAVAEGNDGAPPAGGAFGVLHLEGGGGTGKEEGMLIRSYV